MTWKSTLYQSGQRVSVTGTYAVVSIEPMPPVLHREATVREFHSGDAFPAYKGARTIWHLVCAAVQPPLPASSVSASHSASKS
ncbi:MAG TPA: hypothetical protein VKQ72_16280 [Aggregatilineales bacterium]|nr:hypothetical protein [Aggregatilineales bacterium]